MPDFHESLEDPDMKVRHEDPDESHEDPDDESLKVDESHA